MSNLVILQTKIEIKVKESLVAVIQIRGLQFNWLMWHSNELEIVGAASKNLLQMYID